jgi:hypothetical protein
MVPLDTPVPEDLEITGDTLFSFWNDLMHEKFDEEGDGVLFALHRLQASITGMYSAIHMQFIFAYNISLQHRIRIQNQQATRNWQN